jgi:hypothetical protein
VTACAANRCARQKRCQKIAPKLVLCSGLTPAPAPTSGRMEAWTWRAAFTKGAQPLTFPGLQVPWTGSPGIREKKQVIPNRALICRRRL